MERNINITQNQEKGAKGFLNKFNPFYMLKGDPNLQRLLIITAVVFLVMAILNPARFLSPLNFSSMSYQFPEFGLLSIAIMVSMLTGGIDLSVVGIANLSGILAALVLTKLMPQGAGTGMVILYCALAVFVAVVTGLICGWFNGILISRAGITPILATLGTMQLFTGFAVVITNGHAVFGYPEPFLFLGNGKLAGIPVPLIIFAICAFLVAVLLNHVPFGHKIYMMGTNPIAAKFSGINNRNMLMKTYALCGLLAALGGIIMIAHTNSAKADYGVSYVLQGILIAVLGGINPNGGFGKISGLVLAILCLQFLSSGFNMLRFSNFFKEFIWGAVLIVVMVVNYISHKRQMKAGSKSSQS